MVFLISYSGVSELLKIGVSSLLKIGMSEDGIDITDVKSNQSE